MSHHAAVEVLVHLAEGVGGYLPLAGDDDADISDSEWSVWLALRSPAVGDVDALGGRVANVGRTTWGRGLDEVTSRLQFLFPLVQNTETPVLKQDILENTYFLLESFDDVFIEVMWD